MRECHRMTRGQGVTAVPYAKEWREDQLINNEQLVIVQGWAGERLDFE